MTRFATMRLRRPLLRPLHLHLHLATGALLSSLAMGPACSCQRPENVAAKKRLSAPPPPSPVQRLSQEKIDASKVGTDKVVRRRVNRMHFGEVALRLGSGIFTSSAKLSFQRPGSMSIRSQEDVRIVQSKEGDFSVDVLTGNQSAQKLAYVNGVFFLKNNNGQWRISRDPSGEREAYREDGAGIWRSFYDLFTHALAIESPTVVDLNGRKTVHYNLVVKDMSAEAVAIGNDQPPLPKGSVDDAGVVSPPPHEDNKRLMGRLSAWRKQARARSGGGEMWVDQQAGVLVKLLFKGALLVGDSPTPAGLKVDIRLELTDIGTNPQVLAPKEARAEIVRSKYPHSPRKILEKKGLVKPLPKPQKAAASQASAPAKPAPVKPAPAQPAPTTTGG